MSLFCEYSFTLLDSDSSINRGYIYGLGITVRPFNFKFIDLLCRTKSYVNPLVGLRCVTAPAGDVETLANTTDRHKNL